MHLRQAAIQKTGGNQGGLSIDPGFMQSTKRYAPADHDHFVTRPDRRLREAKNGNSNLRRKWLAHSDKSKIRQGAPTRRKLTKLRRN